MSNSISYRDILILYHVRRWRNGLKIQCRNERIIPCWCRFDFATLLCNIANTDIYRRGKQVKWKKYLRQKWNKYGTFPRKRTTSVIRLFLPHSLTDFQQRRHLRGAPGSSHHLLVSMLSPIAPGLCLHHGLSIA